MRKLCLILSLLCLVGAGVFWLRPQAMQAEKGPSVRQVIDSTDREVTIPEHPRRVVILNASNLDLYTAAGGAADIVGKPTSQALSEEVKQATAAADEVGIIHSPDVEKILSLKPDLVIGTNVPFHTGLAETLAQAGIPLYIQSLDNMDQLYGALSFYGELTGQTETAAARIEKMKADMGTIKESLAGRNLPASLIVFGSPDSFNMGTKECFTGSLLEVLGGGNIADEAGGEGGYLPLSMEYVAKRNPEVIFVIMHGPAGELEEKMQRDLETNDAWKNIRAVRNHRVYVLPYDLFAVNPGVRAADAMNVLASHLIP